MSNNEHKPIKRRKNTHYTRVLEYLKTHGHINNHIAVYKLEPRNFDLASTIKLLRKDGYDIECIKVNGVSRFYPNKTYQAGDYVLTVGNANPINELEGGTEVVTTVDEAWGKVKTFFKL